MYSYVTPGRHAVNAPLTHEQHAPNATAVTLDVQ